MKKVKIKCFGAFRKFIPSGELEMSIPNQQLDAVTLKKLVSEHIRQMNSKFEIEPLMEVSALATETKVLLNEEMIEGEFFALLPPVCGG